MVHFCLVSLFNSISTFLGYLMTNNTGRKIADTLLNPKLGNKVIHTYHSKNISLKMTLLEFEIAYNNMAVKHANHYDIGISPINYSEIM